MENYNDLMKNFQLQLNSGRIQKAYRYIFDIFSDLGTELKCYPNKMLITNALYHGYLDMTYLPVTTDILKSNGLKIAIVFNYTLFQFELWLSAVNRKKRDDVLRTIAQSNWNKYKLVENNENADAIFELKINGIDEFGDKNNIVSKIVMETIKIIYEIELFLSDYGKLKVTV